MGMEYMYLEYDKDIHFDRPGMELCPFRPQPWSQTSSLQDCEIIKFWCLSQAAYSILLWQPKLTNTVGLFILFLVSDGRLSVFCDLEWCVLCFTDRDY